MRFVSEDDEQLEEMERRLGDIAARLGRLNRAFRGAAITTTVALLIVGLLAPMMDIDTGEAGPEHKNAVGFVISAVSQPESQPSANVLVVVGLLFAGAVAVAAAAVVMLVRLLGEPGRRRSTRAPRNVSVLLLIATVGIWISAYLLSLGGAGVAPGTAYPGLWGLSGGAVAFALIACSSATKRWWQ